MAPIRKSSPPIVLLPSSDSSEFVCFSASHSFIWKVLRFTTMNQDGIYSDPFSIGTSKWQLRVYPNGLQHLGNGHASIFIALIDSESVHARISMAVVSQSNPDLEVRKDFELLFPEHVNKSAGSFEFIRLDELHEANNGYIQDDSINIAVDMTCDWNVAREAKERAAGEGQG